LVTAVIAFASPSTLLHHTYRITGSEPYIPSTAVLIAELMKLVISFIMCFLVDNKASYRKMQNSCYQDLVVSYKDW
jgi:hypothetical protein